MAVRFDRRKQELVVVQKGRSILTISGALYVCNTSMSLLKSVDTGLPVTVAHRIPRHPKLKPKK